MPGSKRLALLVLAAVLTQSGNSWAQDTSQSQQVGSSQLLSIRTYNPSTFRQSWLDRLSGGLSPRLPYRMVQDSHGRILVTDPALSVVHTFDLEQGTRWQFAGDSRHRLSKPAYIAVDAEDRIYVTDLEQHGVLVFERSGRFLHAIGDGLLRMPTGLCVDSRNQKLYVADWWRSQILLFDMQGTLLEVIGSLGGGPGQLRGPGDIVLHDGTLIVLDSINSRFDSFDLQGNFLGSSPFGRNRTPTTFAFDGDGNLFYIDSDSGGLIAVDPRGQVLARLGQLRSFGQWAPRVHGTSFTGITADAVGNILALRPTLNIETIRLVSPAAGKAP